MLLPKIDRALDVAPLIGTLLAHRNLLGFSGSAVFQHRLVPRLRSLNGPRCRELKPGRTDRGDDLSSALSTTARPRRERGPVRSSQPVPQLASASPQASRSSSASAARGQDLQGSGVRHPLEIRRRGVPAVPEKMIVRAEPEAVFNVWPFVSSWPFSMTKTEPGEAVVRVVSPVNCKSPHTIVVVVSVFAPDHWFEAGKGGSFFLAGSWG